MAVSKRLRYEILRRDNHACRYCGATAPDVPLRVDHVTPVALGGTDTPGNLVTSCEPCNSGKSSATVDSAVVDGVSDDAIRWAEAMKKAAAELSEQNQPKLDYRNAFESEWNSWTYPSAGKRLNHELPADWKTSLERFRTAGLPARGVARHRRTRHGQQDRQGRQPLPILLRHRMANGRRTARG
ncbi:HNH endonuclease, partial [Streptomyces sp. Termitarium-T10T-6]